MLLLYVVTTGWILTSACVRIQAINTPGEVCVLSAIILILRLERLNTKKITQSLPEISIIQDCLESLIIILLYCATTTVMFIPTIQDNHSLDYCRSTVISANSTSPITITISIPLLYAIW